MNRSNTSANKDIGHIVKDMLRLLVAYGVAVLFYLWEEHGAFGHLGV